MCIPVQELGYLTNFLVGFFLAVVVASVFNLVQLARGR
jgi:hypothetical protein